jgi:signal transduction histidine kinase
MPEKGPAEVRQLAKSFNMMLKRVQESQQSQREFIANVSHELKTPLTSVQGFAQAILDGAARTPEALHQAASVIYNESERMTRLVMDLLTLARLEGGTAGLQRAPVELSQVLGGIVEKFSIQARRSNVNLNINLNPLPVCMGDGDRLAQVFTNLVDNALKFTPGGGTVSVSAEGGEESVLVKIADTGNGIALEDQNRIFGRFYQVDKSRQGSEKRGVGLGLPIAKQIVLAHHGEIWVESNPGKGCTFLVRVPVSLPSDSTFNRSRRIK